MRDPLGHSPRNVNNSNSYNLTKDSLLNGHVCLRDLHIETFKVGQSEQTEEGRIYDGPGKVQSTGAQLWRSGSWQSRKKEKEPLSPSILWIPKTHLLSQLVSGCGVLYVQNE